MPRQNNKQFVVLLIICIKYGVTKSIKVDMNINDRVIYRDDSCGIVLLACLIPKSDIPSVEF